MTQAQKASGSRALHERAGAFVIPNPWDIGSARLVAELGFEALATTSSGFAHALGRLDGMVTLQEKIDHCRALCAAGAISATPSAACRRSSKRARTCSTRPRWRRSTRSTPSPAP